MDQETPKRERSFAKRKDGLIKKVEQLRRVSQDKIALFIVDPKTQVHYVFRSRDYEPSIMQIRESGMLREEFPEEWETLTEDENRRTKNSRQKLPDIRRKSTKRRPRKRSCPSTQISSPSKRSRTSPAELASSPSKREQTSHSDHKDDHNISEDKSQTILPHLSPILSPPPPLILPPSLPELADSSKNESLEHIRKLVVSEIHTYWRSSPPIFVNPYKV